jgi:hypothetical protein
MADEPSPKHRRWFGRLALLNLGEEPDEAFGRMASTREVVCGSGPPNSGKSFGRGWRDIVLTSAFIAAAVSFNGCLEAFQAF